METQLRMIAIGHVHPISRQVTIEPFYGDDDEWRAAILDSMDAMPDANCEDAYHMGITDRDLGLPSRALDYADAHERAVYTAGKCATRRVLTVDEMLRELDDLQSAMDDEMFWSHHC